MPMERLSDIDPSMPSFTFPKAERERMKQEERLTDEQIDEKEKEIINRIARKAA